MSLSSGMETALGRPGGRIIIGPKNVGLAELTLNSSRQAALDLEAEQGYLDRVRAKARDLARDILNQAMAEAEELRINAREQGMREGRQDAAAEVKKVTEQKAAECRSLLESLERAGQSVWRAHREDLVLLVQVMVEKILAVELDARRRESLENLLDQAVDMMEVKRRVVITVHPQDAELMQELLRQSKAEGAGLEGCKIKTDESIDRGGLILECDHGMVDNTIASRQASLREIVDQLTLEETG